MLHGAPVHWARFVVLIKACNGVRQIGKLSLLNSHIVLRTGYDHWIMVTSCDSHHDQHNQLLGDLHSNANECNRMEFPPKMLNRKVSNGRNLRLSQKIWKVSDQKFSNWTHNIRHREFSPEEPKEFGIVFKCEFGCFGLQWYASLTLPNIVHLAI